MAEAREIAPCPEKVSPSHGKSVHVTIDAVDASKEEEEEEVTTQPSPHKPTYRPFVHRTIPLIVLMVLALGLIGALEAASQKLPSARLRGPGAAGPVTSLPNSTSTSIASSSSSAQAARKRQIPGAAASTSASPTSHLPNEGDVGSGAPTTSPVLGDGTGSVPSSSPESSNGETSPETSVTPNTSTDTGVPAQQSANGTTSSSSTSPTSDSASQTTTDLDGWNYVEPIITSIVSADTTQNSGVAVIVASLPTNYNLPEGAFAFVLSQQELANLGDVVSGGGNGSIMDGGSPLPLQQPRLSHKPLALVNNRFTYFLGTYAPVLMAVILRHLVTPLYRYAKLLDPFERLRAPEGALFREFYLLRHLGTETMLAPYQAYQHRRWTLFWTASLYASVQTLTPLATELTQIRFSAFTEQHTSPQHGMQRRTRQELYRITTGQAVWIDSVIVRVVQGLLGLIFIQLVVVWYRLWKSEPLVPANPASIATMAYLTSHPQTARDFSRIDQHAELRVTMGRFRDRRYRLESYKTRDGQERYGIVPKSGRIRAPPPPKKEEDSPNTSTDSRSAWRRMFTWRKKNGNRAKKTTQLQSIVRTDVQNLAVVTIGTGALFGLILSYILTRKQNKFELFMDSETAGPKIVLSILALCLKSPLRSLWISTTVGLPWQRLAGRARGGGASVRDVIDAVPVTYTPLGGLMYSFRRREWFATGLSLAGGLAVEVLIVLLPGVPYTSRQLYIAAQVSWYGSLASLGLILLVTLLGWLRLAFKQGARSPWPRPPVSVGIVASYVAGTAMATDFANDRSAIPPLTTRYEFCEKEGRWMVEYAHEEEPE